MSNTAFNPYAAPSAPVEDVSANAEAEAIRKAHINHEASVKAVGILYYLGGIGVTIAALGPPRPVLWIVNGSPSGAMPV